MTQTLFHIYTPLILWTGFGLFLFRFIPDTLPRLLGRSLYWVGIPLQILALTRRTEFSANAGLIPVVTLAVLITGAGLAWLGLQFSQKLTNRWSNYPFEITNRASEGSFILAAMLGNTGFVGLAIVPSLISDQAIALAVFYNFSQNLLGTNGLGVLLGSYFGRSAQKNLGWVNVRDLLTVPSLWAFTTGYLTRSVQLPTLLESGLQASLWIVIPSAFLLMGMRIAQIRGWKSFQAALLPAILKVVVVPALVGITATILGIWGDPRLTLVLMSGMPTAFASLILAEEYDLDRDLIASSIVVTTLLLMMMIPFWLLLLTR